MLRWLEAKSRAKSLYKRARQWMRRDESGARSTRARRNGGRIAAGIAGGILSMVAVLVIVLATLDWNSMRGPVSRYLSSSLNRPVSIEGDLDVALFSWTPRTTMSGLVIQQPDWVTEENNKDTDAFADIERIAVSVDLWELLTGDLVLPEFALTRPIFRLIRDSSGRANWLADPEDDEAAPALPAIRHFIIEGGKLTLRDAEKKFVLDASFSSQEIEGGSQNAFSLDGKGELNRASFTLKMTGDPLLNIDPDEPYGFKTEVRAGATRVVANGSLSRPFDFGYFAVDASFSGSDLADLYDLTGLALPNTPPYGISGKLSRDLHTWRIEGLDGKVGDSDIRGALSVDASGERPYLTGNVASRELDFDDLGPVFGLPPSTGAGETASTEQKQEARRHQATGRVLSDKPLDVDRLRQMDAKVQYKADKVMSRDFPLRSAKAQISLSKGVLKLDDVAMSFAQGALTGNLKVDATKDTPITDIDVRLSKLRLEQFMTGLGSPPPLQGELLARAKLRGVGISVHDAASTADGSFAVAVPNGQMRKAFAELMGINIARGLLLDSREQTNLRCGVAVFSANDGIMNLDQFVFDTDVVQVSGEGTVNLKTESLDLQATGHPKEIRLVRVRAPITISGPMGGPSVGIKAGPALGQGALAAGLGALLSPLGAILPFIDPGLAEDANCVALLNQPQSPVATTGRPG